MCVCLNHPFHFHYYLASSIHQMKREAPKGRDFCVVCSDLNTIKSAMSFVKSLSLLWAFKNRKLCFVNLTSNYERVSGRAGSKVEREKKICFCVRAHVLPTIDKSM